MVGLRNVRDEIEIAYDAGPAGIDLHVQQALERSALVPDDSDVDVVTRALFLFSGLASVAFGVVLFARPGVGAVTLALLFGLFAIIYGVSQIILGVETRRAGKTLDSVLEKAA